MRSACGLASGRPPGKTTKTGRAVAADKATELAGCARLAYNGLEMFDPRAKYPTPSEFSEWLKTKRFGDLVDRWLFGGAVYAFDEKPEAGELLVSHLATQLGTQQENIRIVGSAKLGFSLSPDSFSRSFGEDSDIDVIVVDSDLFDAVWHSILRWNYPRRRDRLIAPDFRFREARSREIYWGWMEPDQVQFAHVSYTSLLAPVQELKARWFEAFRSLGRDPNFARRDVSGRLYRNWDFARLYHENGLGLIQTS